MRQLCVAVIGAPKGLDGMVHLFRLGEGQDSFRSGLVYRCASAGAQTPDQALAEDAPLLRLAHCGTFRRNRARARFVGIDDRESAERLKGLHLYLERSSLPSLDSDEYYHADLVGLRVYDARDGKEIGWVKGLADFGAGPLLDLYLDRSSSSTFLPFTRDCVPVCNPEKGFLSVTLEGF